MARMITVVLVFILSMAGVVLAGDRHGSVRIRLGGGAPLERRLDHPFVANYIPYQAPLLVLSPYGPVYYVPPAVVVTAPYFCVFHHGAFVSRVGLLDHLSGRHKIPLDVAATICPDGVASCVFPSY